ncbi:MAG TPA: hypothetical protein QGF58_19295 [Myxococcota bacterium]|nr:hypothetical protein [Myxococcota bacterium]
MSDEAKPSRRFVLRAAAVHDAVAQGDPKLIALLSQADVGGSGGP